MVLNNSCSQRKRGEGTNITWYEEFYY